MRVLFMSDDPKCGSGFGAVTKYATEAMKEQGHEVVILGVNAVSKENLVKDKKGKIKDGMIRFERNRGYHEQLTKSIKLVNPDLVLVQNDLNVMDGLIFGGSLVLTPLSETHSSLPIAWIGPYDSLIPHNLDKRVMDYLKFSMPYTLYGQRELGATSVFRLGPAVFDNADTIIRENMPTKAQNILTVGANRWKKKLDKVVESFLHYNKINPDSTLTIKTQPGGYFDHLFRMNLPPSIKVINSHLSIEQLRALFLTHDTYICATPNEGWGLPVTDAQHAGMRIVAVDFPVTDESCNSKYAKIPCYDYMGYDGYRYIPVPIYTEIPNLYQNLVEPSPEKVNHWKESQDNLKRELAK